MTRFGIPLPTIAGLMTGHIGTPIQLTTLSEGTRGLKLDLQLTSSDTTATDTVVRVGDGVGDVTGTITAGDRFATVDASSLEWAGGTDLEMEVTAAGDGMGLSGVLYVEIGTTSYVIGAGWVTLAETKVALGLTTTTAAEDAYLNRMIDLVTERGRIYTGRVLNLAQWVETFYYPRKVIVREYPIASLDAVSRDGSALTVGNVLANLERGEVWQDGSYAEDWAGTSKVEVTYTAGYDPLPSGVKEWCFQAIAARWRQYESDGAGLNEARTPLKVVYPDAGSVDFGNAGTLSAQTDGVLGVSMRGLDPYVDHSLGLSAEYSAWVVAP